MNMPIERTPACDDATRRLWEFLDEELLESEEEDIGRHLRECPRCERQAAARQRLLDRIAAVTTEHCDLSALRDRIATALAARAKAPKPMRCRIRYLC